MDGRLPLLAIDASTPRIVLAVGATGSEREQPGPWLAEHEHRPNEGSEVLLPRIRALLDASGWTFADLRLLACGVGPGSFTGTRVAVATAKGLALALGLPIVPVSSLRVLAASAEAPGLVAAALDAGRDLLYAAAYELDERDGFSSTCVIEPACTTLAAWITSVAACPGGKSPIWIGQIPDHVELAGRRIGTSGPSAQGLWRVARAAAREDPPIDAERLAATYLRGSYAELGLNRPKRGTFRSPYG